MASLLKKKVNGRLYYYYVQTQRVNGRVQMAQQIYLGSADKILQRCQQADCQPVAVQHRAFGDVAALFALCRRLGLIEMINQQVPSPPRVGEYLCLAALNRCIAPKSKNQIQDWYARTVLPDLLGLPCRQVTSQRFWDAMHALDEDGIQALEVQLWRRLLQEFSLPLEALVYDTSNFFSYVQDSVRGELLGRGHNKAGKHHLNQVGLALVVSKVFGLPFLHQIYPGPQHDALVFPQVMRELAQRYMRLAQSAEQVTLIFDKGNNSADNLAQLDEVDHFHFVGSLVPAHFPDLLRVRLSRYQPVTLANGKQLLAFATRKVVFGHRRPVVVSYNADTAAKQQQVLQRHLQAASADLLAVHWNRVKQRADKVADILAHHRVKDLLQVTFNGHQAHLSADQKAIRLRQQAYGKTVLFTDHQDWSATEVVQAYHDKAIVEEDFRCLNDPHAVHFRPVHHWTDQKIRVHAFICVLGLLLWRCLQMQLVQANLAMSLPVLREELADLRAIIVVDAAQHATQLLSHRSAMQHKLFDLFDLQPLAHQLGLQLSS